MTERPGQAARRRPIARAGLALLALAILAGCAPPPPPPPAAETSEAAPGPANAPKLSPESLQLKQFYARVQRDFRARGLMRTDDGSDIPFTASQLADDFIRIAMFDEYVSTRRGGLRAQQRPSRLRRWGEPIRMSVIFGETVPEAQRAGDRADVRRFAGRLSRLSGVPISFAPPEAANYHVMILNEPERRETGPRLEQLVPGIDATALRAITGMPRQTFCLVFAFSRGDTWLYTDAVAVIRGEHPDLLRLSCIHEELAQGMGLANDSPLARPSIFNDNEEFSLLTVHDELLLRMLYDGRLRAGMDGAEARPVARVIAAELTGDAGSS